MTDVERRNGDMETTRGSRPVPDPTELTDRAISKSEKALHDYVDGQLAVRDERLSGIDEATKLRLAGVESIPSRIEKEVSHLELLHNEKFASVDQRFTERDIRSEREARDNKVAVDAAFAAQKEAAGQENLNNQKAIDKSETATAEKINKLEQLFTTKTEALDDKIDDLKERINAVSLTVNGSGQHREGSREGISDIRVIALFAIAAIGLALSLFAALR